MRFLASTRSLAIPTLWALALACSAAPSGDTTSVQSSGNALSKALAPSGSIVLGVAAYRTPSDGAMHALAATTETLEEVDFDGTIVDWRRRLGYFAGVVGTGAFYAPQDGNQHVIVATDQGDVHEVWFNPATNTYADAPLAHFTSSIAAVDGFTSDDDGREHAIVATADGTITDVSWIPAQGITRAVIGRVTGVVAVDGFYAPDDTNRIVHVATSGGALVEIFYHPGRGGGQSTIATFSGIVDIAGFYTPDDQDRHCIVATSDGVLTEVYYNPSWGLGRAPIGNYAGVASVAGFYSPDGYRRVVIGTTAGSVSELHYSPTKPWGTLPLGTYYRPQPAFDDVGPTSVNGENDTGNNSASGRVTQLAVASTYALAISPNAGVWELPYAADAQMGWIQLRNSPQYANVVAIDPTNESRIVVGQRNVEGDPFLNMMGLWESTDQGATWGLVFDPVYDPDCAVVTDPNTGFPGAHLIASVAVAPGASAGTSSTYAGTACGIARSQAGGSYQILAPTRGLGIVTALTSSQLADGRTMVWARTTGSAGRSLLYSSNDGATWTVLPFPASVNGTPVSFASRGDDESIAAYGAKAVFVASAAPNTTEAVFFDSATSTWIVESVAPTDGTGLNGRRLVKAFPNASASPTIVVGTSQDLYVGARWDTALDRPLAWQHYAATGERNQNDGDPNAIHADTWDFAIANGAPSGPWSLVASDGGVYRFAGGQSNWEAINAGLRVHSAQGAVALPVGHLNPPRLAYATVDNESWWRADMPPYALPSLPPPPWSSPNTLGDTTWVQGDQANPHIASDDRHGMSSLLLDFGHPEANPSGLPPVYTIDCVDTDCHGMPFGFGQFHFIQSLETESAPPYLDALLLVQAPYVEQHSDGSYGPVSLPSNPDGGPILLRNRAFAQNPTTLVSQLQPPAWTVEAQDLPVGTAGVLSSGGHATPTYYAVVREASGNHLYKRAPGASGWTLLTAAGSFFLEPSWLFVANVAGPVFVNPFNPNVVVVVGCDASGVGAVRVSNDGGKSFTVDEALTALASESGRIDVTQDYFGGSDLGTPVGMTRHDAMLGALSSMTWNRERPREVVAGSVLGGAWFSSDGRTWQSLAPSLPTPRAPVASVAIDPEAASVSTFGRGFLRVTGYREAPLATFFRDRTTGGTLAQLVAASGAPVASTSVDAFIVTTSGAWQFLGKLTTDANGNLATPTNAAGSTVHLSFAGTPTLAGATTAFRRSP